MTTPDLFSEQKMLATAQQANMQVTIVDHPLVRDALSTMRNQETSQAAFREAVHALAPHLIYAATADLKEKDVEIETPLAPIMSRQVSDQVVLIPVLRSGIGMHEPAVKIFPHATTIFAGMARDEATAIPHWYYDLKSLDVLRQGQDSVFLVLDPMLATGGSAVETITRIKEFYPHGVIKMIAMIAAPEGVATLNTAHPDVAITVAAVDSHLNEKKYIVPGLGDAGDRQFGTV